MKFRGLFENRRFVWTLIISIVLTAIFLVSNFFVVGGDKAFNMVNTLISPASALFASFLFFQASTNKKDVTSRFIWTRMAIGFGLWGLADVIWAFYAIVLKETVPFPSIADFIWTIGYVPLYYALINRLRTLKVVPSAQQINLMIGLNLLWIVLTSVFVLSPIIQNFDQQRLFESIFNILYPLADIGLIILTNLIVILLKEGRFSLIWRLIFGGILVMTVSDLLFAYGTWNGLYYPEGRVNTLTVLADTTYSLAYIISGIGIFIYRFIWTLEEKFKLSIESVPAAKFYTFMGTNKNNQLVLVDENLYCLFNDRAGTDYFNQPLADTLRMKPEVLQTLLQKIVSEKIICNDPIVITTQDNQKRKVWMTAMAIDNPGDEFAGINIALSADIDVPEGLRRPKNPEIQGMLKYLLSIVDSRPQDEIQTMQIYFLEVIRLLSSMLYQFGGTQFRNALFEQLQRTIQQKNMPVKINGNLISFAGEQEGKDLAISLTILLKTATDFVSNLIGEQIVREDLEALEKPLDSTILRDLDKYKLRTYHSPSPSFIG